MNANALPVRIGGALGTLAGAGVTLVIAGELARLGADPCRPAAARACRSRERGRRDDSAGTRHPLDTAEAVA